MWIDIINLFFSDDELFITEAILVIFNKEIFLKSII